MSNKNKELKKIEHQISRLEEMMKLKQHGPDSNELKLLSQLSDLYRKRNELKTV